MLCSLNLYKNCCIPTSSLHEKILKGKFLKNIYIRIPMNKLILLPINKHILCLVKELLIIFNENSNFNLCFQSQKAEFI